MPCNSDYLNPTRHEREMQLAAKLLKYVLECLARPVPAGVAATAENMYANADYIPDLCAAVSSLSDAQRDAIVYNGRDSNARKLADWWERHEAEDIARMDAVEQRKLRLAADIKEKQDELNRLKVSE